MIRAMRIADLIPVTSIDRRSFPAPWRLGQFLDELRKATASCLVVTTNAGAVTGFAISSLVVDEAEIISFAVEPGRRFRGLGTQLLDSLIEQARADGAGQIHLEVRESNATARRLYSRSGFETVGRRRRYYAEDHEDAMLMRLNMAPLGVSGGAARIAQQDAR